MHQEQIETRIATLVFVIDRSRSEPHVLMGDKVGGHATIGTTNGYGGGWEKFDRTVRHTTVRECPEEGKFHLKIGHLRKVGLIDFFDHPDQIVPNYHMHIHVAEKWEGIPQPTEEVINPTWYPLSKLPLDKTMPDKCLWLPRILNGDRLRGWVYYTCPQRVSVAKHRLRPLKRWDR